MMEEHCDVLIVGGGSAGIGAARRLLGLDNDATDSSISKESKNLKVIIIEARNRVGGRAWTSDELQCGVGLDHGGKWIHGSTSPSNIMTKLAREHNIATTAGNKSDASYYKMKKRTRDMTRVILPIELNGTRQMQSRTPTPHAEKAVKLLYKQLCEDEGKESLIAPLMHSFSTEASYLDCYIQLANSNGDSVIEWLKKKARDALKAVETRKCCRMISEISSDDMDLLIRETIALLRLHIYCWLENYEGACLDQCSLLHTYDGDILPGPNANVEGGYGHLVETLADPLDIRFGIEATTIDKTKSQDGVIVHCKTDDSDDPVSKTFTAKVGCIITVPLGVLKKDNLHFIPPLPDNLSGAIGRLGMCLMNKIEILFPYQWWPDGVGELLIASENTASIFTLCDMPYAQFIVEEDEPAILVCYSTGMFAEQIEQKSNEEIKRDAVEALRVAFLDNGEPNRITRGIVHKNKGNDDGSLSSSSSSSSSSSESSTSSSSDSSSTKVMQPITEIPDPTRINVTKWRSDPNACGSWTVFNAGSRGMKDVDEFQTFNMTSERIYFAGEHTCNNSIAGLDIGTVHGAYISGRVAAEGLLKNRSEKSQ